MDFVKALGVLLKEFENQGIDSALIGGLALSFAGVDRKTHDIDFMVLLKDSEKVDKIMKNVGYQCLHRTENVANYHGLSEMGQVDFLFARREYALGMLANAEPHDFMGFKIRAVRPDDIIGLKVQSSTSDPARAEQDILDIKAILRNNSGRLDMDRIREYFKLFNREKEFDEIIKEKP